MRRRLTLVVAIAGLHIPIFGCADETNTGPENAFPAPELKAGGPLGGPVTVTLSLNGAYAGINRPDLILSQTITVDESALGPYSNAMTHPAPQSLSGGALPVDVASGTFDWSAGATFLDRNGSAVNPPSMASILSAWNAGGGGSAPAPALPVTAELSGTAWRGPPPGTPDSAVVARFGERQRIGQPLGREQRAKALRGLEAEYEETDAPPGLRRFRRNGPAGGAMEVDFDRGLAAITKTRSIRNGVVVAVTEREYTERGVDLFLRAITTTTYGPDGSVTGKLTTTFQR